CRKGFREHRLRASPQRLGVETGDERRQHAYVGKHGEAPADIGVVVDQADGLAPREASKHIVLGLGESEAPLCSGLLPDRTPQRRDREQRLALLGVLIAKSVERRPRALEKGSQLARAQSQGADALEETARDILTIEHDGSASWLEGLRAAVEVQR